MYDYTDSPGVDHFDGTDIIVTWIKRLIGVNLLTSDLLLGDGSFVFRSADTRTPQLDGLIGKTVILKLEGGAGSKRYLLIPNESEQPASLTEDPNQATRFLVEAEGNKNIAQLSRPERGEFLNFNPSDGTVKLSSSGADSGSFWSIYKDEGAFHITS